MGEIILEQCYIFKICVISGILLALVYDWFRLIRSRFSHREIVVHLEDILYTIYAFLHIFFIVQMYDQGQLRLYLFVGFVLGAMAYLLLFHRLFWWLSGGILDFLQGILCALQKMWYPLYKITRKTFEKILKNISNTYRIINTKK